MSTTNLFVELVVIGIGVFVWILLLVGASVGYSWFAMSDSLLIGSALPTLAVVYVLGIIWDRIADYLFQKLWTDDLKASRFADRGSYYDARRVILTQSQPLSELLEYGRSRLRICRGWTLNAIMIAVSLNLLLWSRYGEEEHVWSYSIVGTIVSLAMAGGSWFAWNSLAKAEYRKVEEQAAYLLALKANENE